MFLLHPVQSVKTILKSFEDRIGEVCALQRETGRRLEYVQEALGRVEARQLIQSGSRDLKDYEFRVFSQWGEDGIIQYLVRHAEIARRVFVEFGVGDYTESNTRFLLVNNNWTGLVMDSSSENIISIKKSPIYWAYNIKAVQSFVTRDNINEVLRENGVTGEIGLLSIDIDGNDFWVWRAITVISPVIVVVEYNHRFGKDAAVTIPYEENFDRRRTALPPLYFGASLKALCWVANRKGYAFVGCNRNGVNAFFIRRDKKPHQIKEVGPEEGYFEGKFSEFLGEEGFYIKRSPEEERRLIMSLPLVSVEELE
jgi:hypothetical protein